MMVPRSFVYSSPRQPSPDRRDSQSPRSRVRQRASLPALANRSQNVQKAVAATPLLAASSFSTTVTMTITPGPTSAPASAPMPAQAPAHTPKPTAPVFIPPRHTQTLNTRGHHGGRRHKHKPEALPPAVAALLAVTAIPPPKGRTFRQRLLPVPRVSIDELVREWQTDSSKASSGSPLDILLEPVDTDGDSVLGEEQGGFLSSRSVSSDSLTSSAPSLDDGGLSFASSGPVTPMYARKPSSMSEKSRRERVACSPVVESCVDDHPLQLPSKENFPILPTPKAEKSFAAVKSTPPKTASIFKSNLTASIQALKSAAKSFSNFTAPSIPPDDLLTRSLFSSQRFASEMRPRFVGAPDPALRRYLNPGMHAHDLPPVVLHPESGVELHDTYEPDDASADTPPKMIQMKTYSRSRKRRSSPVPPVERDVSPSGVRGREPRENSDFLRVIVLEMNMRRTGKLDAKAGGRARVWLPPRKGAAVVLGRGRDVPRRWRAVSVNDF